MKDIIPDSMKPIAGLQYSPEAQQLAAEFAEVAKTLHEMYVEILLMAQWTDISKERIYAVWKAGDLSWSEYKMAIYFAFSSWENHEFTIPSTQN